MDLLHDMFMKIIGSGAEAATHTPVIIAHRGASGYCPENTRSAFLKAIEMGADSIELDIQLSKDGHLVVIHDPYLGRTVDGKGRIRDFLYSELSLLDAGSWFGPAFAEERILNLEETLELLDGKADILIEIKKPRLYPGIEKKLAQALEKVSHSKVIVQSFDLGTMQTFKMLCPHIQAGLLIKRYPWIWTLKRLKGISASIQYINPKRNIAGSRLIKRIKRAGLHVFVWTVRDREEAHRLASLGVDGIITDFPDLLKLNK
ncbi:glycerophosphodiester phosphodiesterase [Peribacillus sp. SCS-37]|uniref:glycerophosphodiester phosphodiesterase n=1 Tax=Paraperibacillus esterisolvens TaxID=3115296 RepID=UPI003905D251